MRGFHHLLTIHHVNLIFVAFSLFGDLLVPSHLHTIEPN